jgi:acyl-CoA reductase-like NAD-dependent aldehyde dehydrogenase
MFLYMKMPVGGAWTESESGRWMDVTNPATGIPAGRVPRGSAEDVGAAVEAAEAAFDAWSALLPRERGKILFFAAQEVRTRADEIAELLTREQGKPLAEAKNEILGYANVLEYYHSISGALHGDAAHLPSYGYSMVLKKPLGVCAAIIPWNMPALIMAWKIGAALVAGNTFVLKPASSAPLTPLTLAGILEKAGLPAGVLNLVTGPGPVAGEALVCHPSVRRVSFTGEETTGRRIAQLAAAGMKPVTLELGGSDPMIVAADADLDLAVQGAVSGRFYNCGQTCTAVKRLFVAEPVADEFIRRLTAKVAAIRVGSGLDPGVTMGPLNNPAQADRVAGLVDRVRERDEGTVILGGGPPAGEAYANGYYYKPTLVTDPAPDSALLTEEVFGPVLPIVVADDLGDAITRANRTAYGLGASVWTRSLPDAAAACEGIRAGMVWVNQHLRIPPEVPFGGTGISGTGRENGYAALDPYLEQKTILIKP